jgi:Kdo2-lipid IVA lauroyltransferase/acyltransferase
MLSKGSLLLKAKHLVEAALVYPLYYLLKIFPIKISSFALGKLTRLLGRYINRPHDIALKNIKHCFPEKTDEEIKNIALNSWENLGRIAGELPHIAECSDGKIQELCPISGVENIESALEFANKNDAGLLMVSAHIGNWEISARMLLAIDPDTALIYRKANNPYVDNLIQKLRGKYTDFIIPKGDRGGIRDIIKHLKKGGRLGILSDQKVNEGVEVEIFGKKILAPATAGDLCAKYNMPIVPFRVIRDEKEKTAFVLRADKPIYPEDRTSQEIMQLVYNGYERWIKEYPNQWFWQHNRFDLGKKRNPL